MGYSILGERIAPLHLLLVFTDLFEAEDLFLLVTLPWSEGGGLCHLLNLSGKLRSLLNFREAITLLWSGVLNFREGNCPLHPQL